MCGPDAYHWAPEGYGPVETAVRLDVGALGELTGIQRSLAETAYALARQLDAGAGMAAAAVARELRATLAEITKDVGGDDGISAFIAELGKPDVPAPLGDAPKPKPADAGAKGRRGSAATG